MPDNLLEGMGKRVLEEAFQDFVYHGTDDGRRELIAKYGLCATELCDRNFTKCQRGIYATPNIFLAEHFAGIANQHNALRLGITDPFRYADEVYQHDLDIYRFNPKEVRFPCKPELDPAHPDAIRFKKCPCISPELLERCSIPATGLPEGETITKKRLTSFCADKWERVQAAKEVE